MICDSIGITSSESPGDISLCTKHYQQVYRMLIAKSDACKSCGVLNQNSNHNFGVAQEELRDDHSLRQMHNSELVDDVAGAEATSDHEQDEENLSEDH